MSDAKTDTPPAADKPEPKTPAKAPKPPTPAAAPAVTATTTDPEIALMATISEHLAGYGPKTALQVAETLAAVAPLAALASPEQVARALDWTLARVKPAAAAAPDGTD